MKSTFWIKNKSIEIENELKFVSKQIEDRNINYEDLWNHKYISKDGKTMNISLLEHLSALTAKLVLIKEILSKN